MRKTIFMLLFPFCAHAQTWEDSVVTTQAHVFICNVEGVSLQDGESYEWFFSSSEQTDTLSRYEIIRTAISSKQCIKTGRQESVITKYYTKPKEDENN